MEGAEFARKLADNDKIIRMKAIQSLKNWFLSKSNVENGN